MKEDVEGESIRLYVKLWKYVVVFKNPRSFKPGDNSNLGRFDFRV
ncbi:MAG: hypothetical protein ACRECH_13260 [Nitrososphaerales archaeon]